MALPELSFSCAKADHEIIRKIADRVLEITEQTDRMHIIMNITACHANGCPLRLQDLLESDEFNFLHDINGIDNCIDRDTGKLTGYFLPRFAA